MTCRECAARLLEADPAELSAGAASPMARHLAGCAECRARAERILAANRALDAALAGPVAEEQLDAAVARAVTAPPRHRARWGVAAIPLATAAGIALVLLGDGAPPPPGPPHGRTRSAAQFSVEAPAGRNVIVLGTENPTITIVWFYERERQP